MGKDCIAKANSNPWYAPTITNDSKQTQTEDSPPKQNELKQTRKTRPCDYLSTLGQFLIVTNGGKLNAWPVGNPALIKH